MALLCGKTTRMEQLRTYLNSLTPPEQAAFAERCKTSIGYLRKAICIRQNIGESTVICIERESRGRVRCEQLRPDVDWAYLRNSGLSSESA